MTANHERIEAVQVICQNELRYQKSVMVRGLVENTSIDEDEALLLQLGKD